jgi:ribonuclease HI
MSMADLPIGYTKGLPVPFVYGRIFAYTDGGCDNKDGSGGWGCIMRYNTHEMEMYGGMPGQTNNTMELRAIYEAFLSRKNHATAMTIVSDSQYALGCLTLWHMNWRKTGWLNASKKPVANKDLIECILLLIQPGDEFHWVKGHAGHDMNERVDRLATKGRAEFGYAVEGEDA